MKIRDKTYPYALMTREARKKNRESLLASYRSGKTVPYFKGKKRPDFSKWLREQYATGKRVAKPGKLDKSVSWKGDNAGYYAIHEWLKVNFGKADCCENLDCVYPRRNGSGSILVKPKRFEWAYLGKRGFSRNRKLYIKLCCSCHRKYDMGLLKLFI